MSANDLIDLNEERLPVGCRRVCQALAILIVYARIEREIFKVFVSF